MALSMASSWTVISVGIGDGSVNATVPPAEVARVKATRQQGENGPVSRCQSGPLELSSQYEDLMAQRQDLGVTLVTTHQQQP